MIKITFSNYAWSSLGADCEPFWKERMIVQVSGLYTLHSARYSPSLFWSSSFEGMRVQRPVWGSLLCVTDLFFSPSPAKPWLCSWRSCHCRPPRPSVELMQVTGKGQMIWRLLYIFSSANCDLKQNITQLHTFHIWLNPGTADIVLLVVLGHHIK